MNIELELIKSNFEKTLEDINNETTLNCEILKFINALAEDIKKNEISEPNSLVYRFDNSFFSGQLDSRQSSEYKSLVKEFFNSATSANGYFIFDPSEYIKTDDSGNLIIDDSNKSIITQNIQVGLSVTILDSETEKLIKEKGVKLGNKTFTDVESLLKHLGVEEFKYKEFKLSEELEAEMKKNYKDLKNILEETNKEKLIEIIRAACTCEILTRDTLCKQ